MNQVKSTMVQLLCNSCQACQKPRKKQLQNCTAKTGLDPFHPGGGNPKFYFKFQFIYNTYLVYVISASPLYLNGLIVWYDISTFYVSYFTLLCNNAHIFEGGVYLLCFPLILQEGHDDVKKVKVKRAYCMILVMFMFYILTRLITMRSKPDYVEAVLLQLL